MLRKLNSVVRDADALDRVRIDTKFPNYKVNLNPKYLVNDTSKRLINAAYQLEFLTKKVPNIKNILNFGKYKMDGQERLAKETQEFNDRVIVENVPVLKLDTKNLEEADKSVDRDRND